MIAVCLKADENNSVKGKILMQERGGRITEANQYI